MNLSLQENFDLKRNQIVTVLQTTCNCKIFAKKNQYAIMGKGIFRMTQKIRIKIMDIKIEDIDI